MKKLNRLCELKLRDADLLLAVAHAQGLVPRSQADQMKNDINEAWRLLLVNQFHDVLPGSSIELAHDEARLWFRKSIQLADDVAERAVKLLGHTVCPVYQAKSFLNTLPWEREILLYNDNVPCSVAAVKPLSSVSTLRNATVTWGKQLQSFQVR